MKNDITLYPLVGQSDKQIEWGEDIRKKAITWGRQQLERQRQAGGNPREYLQAMWETFEACLQKEERLHARYWIEARLDNGLGASSHWDEQIKTEMGRVLIPLRERMKREQKSLPADCESCGEPLKLDTYNQTCLACGAYYGGGK